LLGVEHRAEDSQVRTTGMAVVEVQVVTAQPMAHLEQTHLPNQK
jgi:hypothetical protein